MRRFIKLGVLFGLFLGMFYTVVLFFWVDKAPNKFKKNINYRIGSYGHMFTRVREIPKFKDVDVLILGSSHAYRGFDVRIFERSGFKTFNLGSSSQTPIQTEVLLKRYLDILNPCMVVYEVYPGTFCADGVEAAVDLIANDNNDWYSVRMASRLQNVKVLNTLIYAVTKDIFNLNADFKEPIKRSRDFDTYISGGFVEKEVFNYHIEDQPEHRWDFNAEQLDAFERVVKLLKSKNIKMYFVYAPITSVYYQSYINNSSFDSLLLPYQNYYNFNEIMDLNDTLYFYDEHHLNQNGVELFNKKVVQIISDN